MSGGNAIPAISEILECGVHWVARSKAIRAPKYGPPDQLPSDSSDEQSEVGDQCFGSLRLKRKIDAEVAVTVRKKTGVVKTDCVKC
jgi:hypothetical protein